MQIRQYNSEDAKAVRKICFGTTSAHYKKRSRVLYALYCDYYIECEPESCLVAVDEFDRPCGYIMCATDWTRFLSDFTPYLNVVRKESLTEYLIQRAYFNCVKDLFDKYPAHLHIDILPAFQNKGGGRALMEGLKNLLIERNVRGLMLCVDTKNKGAIAFYERMGFERLRSLYGLSLVYGITL